MAALLGLGTALLGAAGVRMVLRNAALQGRRLGPIASAIAGVKPGSIQGAAAAAWAKGGFQAKMDKTEAVQILGLRCVVSLLATTRIWGAES